MKSKGELSARDVAPKAEHSLSVMTSQPFALSYYDGLDLIGRGKAAPGFLV